MGGEHRALEARPSGGLARARRVGVKREDLRFDPLAGVAAVEDLPVATRRAAGVSRFAPARRATLPRVRLFDWLTGSDASAAVETAEAVSFAVEAASVVGLVGSGTTFTPTKAPRIDRDTAMQVGAVKHSHDLICPTAGGLPINLEGPGRTATPWSLFEQPERNVPASITFGRLFEDLFFEKIAWWDVTEIGWHSYPAFVKRLDPKRVQVDADRGTVYVDGVERRDAGRTLIRFDTLVGGVLTEGARAVRTLLHLEHAAALAADGVPASEYFTPAQHMDPATTDEQILDMLNAYQQARRERRRAYVPAALEIHEGKGFNPEQLQLAQSRQAAVLEIARVTGVDPEELGVSTTSRTYANVFDRRKTFLDFTLGAYLKGVRDRLKMPDVTPRGYVPRFDLDDFLQTDTLTRYQTYAAGLAIGALDHDEMRAAEGKAPLAAPPAPVAPPANVRALPAPNPQENAS
jgi:hypothetical protein